MPGSTRVIALSAAAAVALSVGVAGVAYASGGDEDSVRHCKDFTLQKDAQIALEANVLGLINLDVELGGDKNGIACDKPVKKVVKHRDHDKDGDKVKDKDCEDFDSQKDAQKVLDKDKSDPFDLDQDDDGIACEWLIDDDDSANDDDDKSDKKDKKKDSDEKKKDDSDDDSDDGGQVKVHPKGGVDTGGWALETAVA